MTADQLISRGLYVVTDTGTEAATLAVPFIEPRPATEPEADTFDPGTEAVLAAVAAVDARAQERHQEWKAAHATVLDAVLCLAIDVSTLSDRLNGNGGPA